MNTSLFKKLTIILAIFLHSLIMSAIEPMKTEREISTGLPNFSNVAKNAEAQEGTRNQWDALPEVDFSSISPDSIQDWLMDRPAGQGTNHDIDYYIGHFHRLANAIVPSGLNKGFIDISLWRNPADNQPYNARVMENITTLAWFYTQEENWNPYYADPDLRKILEAALTFWVNMQHDDGRFSEYSQNGWNLAATAFATKFMGETLELLQTGPPIDSVLHEQVKQANRKALMVVFTSESLYNQGKRFSNQYGNAFTGALAHLSMNPDDGELREAFESRLETSLDDFQSQAGYFYENFGPDWSYAFGTHHSNILMAWHYARHDENLAAHYAMEHKRFIDWLSYNAVMQPGDSFFMLHRSIESRQSRPILTSLESPFSEVVPLARAFNTTQEEATQRIAQVRHRVTSNWGNIPVLQINNFNGYSAYSFLHRNHYRWNPDESQRQEALATLPYLASENFIHQRVDHQDHFEVTFVRKPSYYAAFSAGEQATQQQRFGLGLLWNPEIGTVFQSQSRSDDAAWGTVMHPRTTMAWESFPFEVVYTIDGIEAEPVPGAEYLNNGVLEIEYSLGSTGHFAGIGEKKLTFHEDIITVDVSHNGAFTEILPLVLDGSSEVYINHEYGLIQIFQNGPTGHEKLRIEIDDPKALESIYTLNKRSLGSGMSVRPVHIIAQENLFYTITLNPQEPISTGNDELVIAYRSASFSIIGSYPNPFSRNTVANIDFELLFDSDLQLEVFNLAGERIFTQNSGFYLPGIHTLKLTLDNVLTGNYLVCLNASDHIQCFQMVVIY